jgi:ankyrin repeat protein
MLLDHGAKVNVRNSYGSAPLHDAALGGQREIIEMLLDRGAELDARDEESGATPLYNAASWGKLEVVRLLIEKGADVNARNKAGKTPLSGAERTGLKRSRPWCAHGGE